jgi:hypothetical protein
MEFDESAFFDIVEQKGTEVYRATYDGGGFGHNGVAGVRKFADYFWAYDDDGGFGGPYESLSEALSDVHLCFGEVEVAVRVTGLSAAEVAAMLQVEAPIGHAVTINGKKWVLEEDGFAPEKAPARKKPTRKKK